MDKDPAVLAGALPLDLVLPRPQWFRLLDALRAKGLLWIGGGAGAGKTALVRSYLAQRGANAQWHRASRIDPRALGELVKGLKPGTVLVLDDCAEVGPGSSLHVGIVSVCYDIPRRSNVVLIGRGGPPGIYARLIANDAMAVIPGNDLAFSLEESRALAREASCAGPQVDALHSLCSGWAAGIALGLRVLRRQPTAVEEWGRELQEAAGSYFASEVFDAVSLPGRQILVAAALLSEFSVSQVQALSGRLEAGSSLNRFASQHPLLLRTRGSLEGAMRFIPLFRQFLLDRLDEVFEAKELHALAERATAVFVTSPTLSWLDGCNDLLGALLALRRGDRSDCRRLLAVALSEKGCSGPQIRRACLVFPTLIAQLCNEALSAGIATDIARHFIQRYRLPAPPEAVTEWPWPFRVFLLGRFHLLRADFPVSFSRRAQRKPLELLQALIAFGGTEVGTATLADALWPGADGDAGYHSLESALYRLRRLLGAPDAIVMENGKLSLDRRQFWVDVWELERELHCGQSQLGEVSRVVRARQLYHGHFLEHEIEKSWVLQRRQALRSQYLSCIRNAARACETRKLWREAVLVYQGGLDLDMLAEDLYRGLMTCHWRLGEHCEAVRVYRRCRELLLRFLGAAPSPDTEATYQAVRRSFSDNGPTDLTAGGPVARLPG